VHPHVQTHTHMHAHIYTHMLVQLWDRRLVSPGRRNKPVGTMVGHTGSCVCFVCVCVCVCCAVLCFVM